MRHTHIQNKEFLNLKHYCVVVSFRERFYLTGNFHHVICHGYSSTASTLLLICKNLTMPLFDAVTWAIGLVVVLVFVSARQRDNASRRPAENAPTVSVNAQKPATVSVEPDVAGKVIVKPALAASSVAAPSEPTAPTVHQPPLSEASLGGSKPAVGGSDDARADTISVDRAGASMGTTGLTIHAPPPSMEAAQSSAAAAPASASTSAVVEPSKCDSDASDEDEALLEAAAAALLAEADNDDVPRADSGVHATSMQSFLSGNSSAADDTGKSIPLPAAAAAAEPAAVPKQTAASSTASAATEATVYTGVWRPLNALPPAEAAAWRATMLADAPALRSPSSSSSSRQTGTGSCSRTLAAFCGAVAASGSGRLGPVAADLRELELKASAPASDAAEAGAAAGATAAPGSATAEAAARLLRVPADGLARLLARMILRAAEAGHEEGAEASDDEGGESSDSPASGAVRAGLATPAVLQKLGWTMAGSAADSGSSGQTAAASPSMEDVLTQRIRDIGLDKAYGALLARRLAARLKSDAGFASENAGQQPRFPGCQLAVNGRLEAAAAAAIEHAQAAYAAHAAQQAEQAAVLTGAAAEAATAVLASSRPGIAAADADAEALAAALAAASSDAAGGSDGAGDGDDDEVLLAAMADALATQVPQAARAAASPPSASAGSHAAAAARASTVQNDGDAEDSIMAAALADALADL